MDTSHSEHIEQLKSLVLHRFNRTLDSPTDYDSLWLEIYDKTGEQISPSTLKRLYGYNRQSTTPRPSTLSTLARYAGYNGWSDFVSQTTESHTTKASPTNKRARLWSIIGVTIIATAAIVMMWVAKPDDNQTAVDSPKESVRRSNNPSDEICRRWVELTISKCDSVRKLRGNQTVQEYYQVVEEFYFPYVFTTMREGVKADFESLNLPDTVESHKLQSQLFSQCQELCLELMREIAPQLNQASQPR